MDKSDMELSEGWDIVPSDCEDEKEKIKTECDSSSAKEIESSSLVKGAQIQDITEHETVTGNESSSSDIDIIDENLDDREGSATSCFIPSTLTISSSIEKSSDTCSGESVTPETNSSFPPDSEEIKDKTETSESSNCPKNDSADDTDQSASPWIIFGKPLYDWIALFLEFLQNLSGFQWSCLFGLSLCLYFCITINQTNIIALHQKGNVASQMEKMMDELRNDNKLLKEQMLSEMKNDKLVSSFEHQIRELKKENSKLNHMLFDVVKVLEKQKDTQEKLLEKKESDYQAPFKKEINKLKEYINMLKFDNEELQKQLVRMRYASYSQGKHTDTKDKKEFEKDKKHEKKFQGDMKDEKSHTTKDKEDETKDEKDFCSEAPLDLESLKNWNNLIDQVIKELGLFNKDNTEESINVKSDSVTEKDVEWSWKEFKDFINSPNVHMSELVSKCKKSSENVFSKIYKSASSYFNNAKENAQSFFESPQHKEENSDKKFKLWNIINDLGETLVQMKKKAFDSYQKNKFNYYEYMKEFGVHENVQDDHNMEENKGNEDKMGRYNKLYEQKQQNVPNGVEKDKWFFQRADLRAKLRKGEEESSINWFLKRKRKDDLIEHSDEEVIDAASSENEKQEF